MKRRLLLGAAVLAVLAAGIVAAPRLVSTFTQEGPVRSSPSPSPPSPSVPTGTPSGDKEHFPGFWPVATWKEAEQIQKDVDAGRQPWRLEPARVAQAFTAQFVGWRRIKLDETKVDGSAAQGWTGTVTFRPYVGEAGNLAPGTRHRLRLVGLKGHQKPAWFVASLTSDHILVESPGEGAVAASPLPVSGLGQGFEGTINTEIRDDTGRVLHPRPGRNEGFVTGGATQLGPFQGRLQFEPPSAPAGILILTGSTGLEGPAPDWTIVRLRFRAARAGEA